MGSVQRMSEVADAADDHVVVRMVGFPSPLMREVIEHLEGLQREFTLLASSEQARGEVPRRLLEIVRELRKGTPLPRRVDSGGSGEDRTFHVPLTALQALIRFSRVLDEADSYCRDGDFLLTLPMSDELVAFRRWYLGEFVAQVHGMEPLSWEEVDRGAVLGTSALRGETDS